MEIVNAERIIYDNYKGRNDSFMFFLHERDLFSQERFWELYDSIIALKGMAFTEPELARQVNSIYQYVLKTMIWHFSPTDSLTIENFPAEYNGYIERLDYAVSVFYAGNATIADESIFELQR